MVTLPGLGTYSPEQFAKIRAFSPAFVRYEALLASTKLDDIHRRRHSSWCECVAATITGRASPLSVCAYWSQTADFLLKQTWCESGLNDTGALLVVLGKHGAEELNLSSDIDLMVVAESKDAARVEKCLRNFRRRLNTSGESGFCFRLDFDLRPGGTMGPVITSPAQFQDYYWSQGETWERLALVRMRAVIGNPELERQILDLAGRFSYRRFLDFTLLEDLKALRTQVHQKGFERREGELHLKLEVGGIRDIELFTHSLLVLNGGKLPQLRTRSTDEALRLLSEYNLLNADEANDLRENYWFFRQAENLVQAREDRQTHALIDVDGLPARSEIQTRMGKVDTIVSSLLGQVDLTKVQLPVGLPAQRQWLADLGFSTPIVDATWEALIKTTALSYKNDRDERARQEFLFSFVTALAEQKNLDRDMGLGVLLEFVRATRAKATFFSMLLHSPRLIPDLARLFALSPYLGSLLAARPELLDHFVLRVDEPWAADPQALVQQMEERKLLTELWSANRFLAEPVLEPLFANITDTADEIARTLLARLKIEYPECGLEIVALGKWGGRELGLRSDLDFIFVVEQPPTEADFKVARRFISRIPYDVDLRLRPSGQSGPLLVQRSRLHEYWSEEAKAWERQAYLRARPLNPDLVLEKHRLADRGLTADELNELGAIRRKLLKVVDDNLLDLKYAPGGLVDIEFATQIAWLTERRREIVATDTTGLLKQMNWPSRLLDIYCELRRWEQAIQLASTHKVAQLAFEHGTFIKAATLLHSSTRDAKAQVQGLLNEARALLEKLDPAGHTSA